MAAYAGHSLRTAPPHPTIFILRWLTRDETTARIATYMARAEYDDARAIQLFKTWMAVENPTLATDIQQQLLAWAVDQADWPGILLYLRGQHTAISA